MNTRMKLRAAVVALSLATFGLGTQAALARDFGGGRAVVARGSYGHISGRAYGGYRSVYGYRGYGGYRGGYYGGSYRGWGAFGLGLFVASLPLYYSTYWWDGVPYYYSDNNYYRYDDSVHQYEQVTPPAALQQDQAASPASPASEGTELFAYPKNGQTAEQQAKDKDDCKNWARTQQGQDASAAANTQPDAAKRADYLRAQSACLEGRGYSVK